MLTDFIWLYSRALSMADTIYSSPELSQIPSWSSGLFLKKMGNSLSKYCLLFTLKRYSMDLESKEID